MKRTTIIAASLFATLAVAGSASAADENAGEHARDVTAKRCTAEQKADHAAFRAFYGPEHAMRHCIKGETLGVAEFKNAAKQCKDERDAGLEAFRLLYGNNGNGMNALGKCVSEHVRAEDEAPVA